MEGFTQFCIWFLFASVVIELSWKGWKKYKEIKPKVSNTKDKELEEEKKNKD